ncbi:calmodulin-binding protein kinase [Lipomyces oligophaga]|uniref:calmodulin-binding protein kinase n=1 Tax=Lipomyces oligophaga TaxID=45792 RepID=UPI0034CE95B8
MGLESLQMTAVSPPPTEAARVQPCRYKTGKVLGQGSYSVVKEAVHIEDGQMYAVKIINKRLMAGREKFVRSEIKVLKKISAGHPNILTLIDFFETSHNLYLVTDLAYGGELFERLCAKGAYFESDASKLIYKITSAVSYLHAHGIVHRDLKPENLLFRTKDDNDDLLIADFGLSKVIDEEKFHLLKTTCGTPGYMAPEMIRRTGHGKEVDIWAIGIISYFLLCGYTPFDRDTPAEEMKAILEGDWGFEPDEYWEEVSDVAKDFISACLASDPNERWSATDCLRHPFLARVAPTELAQLEIHSSPENHNESDPTCRNDEEANVETNLLPSMKTNLMRRKSSAGGAAANKMLRRITEGAMLEGKLTESPEALRSPSLQHREGDLSL